MICYNSRQIFHEIFHAPGKIGISRDEEFTELGPKIWDILPEKYKKNWILFKLKNGNQ